MQDAFIDYKIYESVTGKNKQRGSVSSNGTDALAVIAIVLLVLGILMIIA